MDVLPSLGQSTPPGRAVDDPAVVRQSIFDKALSTTQGLQPVSNARHSLEISDAAYEGPERLSEADHKRAILYGQSLGRKLKATLTLKDVVTGQPLAQKRTTLANIPYYTNDGTFIDRGSAYTVGSQLRMKPGMFHRQKENGETETHVSTLPGQGVSHRLFLDPKTGIFRIRVEQANMPLVPLLQAMGVKDEQLRQAWGSDLAAVNLQKSSTTDMGKLYHKLVRRGTAENPQEQRQAIVEAMKQTLLDPDVSRQTLGHPYDHVSPEAMLASTRKLLALQNRHNPTLLEKLGLQPADEDDRDHLAYMNLHGPEDMIAERINGAARQLRQLLWKAGRTGNLDSIGAGVFDRAVRDTYLGSGLGQPGESINPVQVFEQQMRVSRLGKGAISNRSAIPSSSRDVQPSYFGAIDLISTPESESAGVDVRMVRQLRKGPNGEIFVPFTDVRSGEMVWKQPKELQDSVIAFPGEEKNPIRSNNGKNYVRALVGGKPQYVTADRVDYQLPHMEQAFNPTSNLVPLKSAMKAQRGAMAARMSVTGDAWVLILRSNGTAYHGPIADYAWESGDLSPSIDKLTHQFCWKPVVAKITHRNTKQLWRVTCDSGRSVTATADHSFVTMADNGRLIKIGPQAIDRNTPVPCGVLLDCPVVHTEKLHVPAGNKHNAHPETDLDLDFDTGWMAGLYLAEGYGPGSNSRLVTFANIDETIQHKVVSVFVKYGIPASILSGRDDGLNDRINVNWKQFYVTMQKEFGDGAYNKHLPAWVLFSPIEFRRGLLAGYLAGDGIVSDSTAGSVSAGGGSRSYALVQGLATLCGTLGLATTIRYSWVDTGPGGSRVKQHGFCIRKEHLHLLPTLHNPTKDGKLQGENSVWSGKRSSDWTPVFDDLQALILRRTRREDKYQRRLRNRRRGTLSRADMVDIFGVDANWATRGWCSSLVWWEHANKSEPVSDTAEFVYDLDMADNVFLANGIFVHNTTQALPLENAEAPLVQNAVPDQSDQSYDELYGARMGAVKADRAGHVLSVSPDSIEVGYVDGTKQTIELAQNRPGNRKTFFHQEPMVQPGQAVGPGTLLARSNFTDDKGTGALGLNVRAGYINARGKNYEDTITISQSLADRFKSLHMYQHKRQFDPDRDVVNKGKYVGIFPGKFKKPQLEAMDDDGVVRVGQTVEYGDPLVLVANKRQERVGEVSRSSAHAFRDQSETWTHHSAGVVTDVAKTDKGVLVAVKTVSPAQEADKFSGRHGNKGVVSILPDEEMPVAEDGRPLEVLYNTHGIVTRTNPSAAIEAWLGKVAALTGKPYKIRDYGDISDLAGFAQQELQRYGLKGTETVTDPKTGKQIPGVLVGNSYFMKLHHVAESKGSGRAFGAYSQDEVPAKGGDTGGKTWGMLHLNALLSHGATGAIADASLVRGQRNHDYWAAVMAGRTPPDPPVPMIYQKFVNQLQAAGINPVREGTRTNLMAMTNADIDRLAENRVLQNNRTVEWKDENLTPIAGGLFDEALHGGAAGKKWSKIELSEPMLNPVMEGPTRKLLGLTEDNFRSVLAGHKEYANGATGPEAIAKALGNINVEREIDQAKQTIRTGRATARNEAVKRLGYLLGIQKSGVHPSQWMWNAVPVLPPRFRAIGRMAGTDTPMVADANYLYRDFFDSHENLKWAKQNLDDVSEERLATYDALKALTGLGDPAPAKLQQQDVKGILKHVLGSSGPKNSIIHRKLLGSQTDLVGRATALTNPDLDMDEVALPEEQAWKAYQPFIVRHLVKRGMSPARASVAVSEQQDPAREALLAVMKERPVIVDRSPVLHRYSMMSFWPRLTKGHSIETNPVINKGMGMDHDGDAIQFHVPATPRAVAEAREKLLPSHNLLSVAEFAPHYLPQQEYLGGLYHASTARSDKPAIRFASRMEALRAARNGTLDHGQEIEIDEGD